MPLRLKSSEVDLVLSRIILVDNTNHQDKGGPYCQEATLGCVFLSLFDV